MLSSAVPTKVSTVWGASAGAGYINTVPIASQIGITPGAASWMDGFVPLNMTSVAAGGVPPFGQDMNGALSAISAWAKWQAAGGPVAYDSAFATLIGGYPKGTVLMSGDGTHYWLNLADSNTTNPESGGANWRSISQYLIAASGTNRTALTTDAVVLRSNAGVTMFDTVTASIAQNWSATYVNVDATAPLILATGSTSGTGVMNGTGGSVWVAPGESTTIACNGTGLYVIDLPNQLNGQCQLVYGTGASITLIGSGGRRVVVGGVSVVNGTGITAANTSVYVNGVSGQSLVANTAYWVYEFILNGTTPTLDFRTQAPTLGANGVKVCGADASRTLVGAVITNASAQFQNSGNLYGVSSYYNQRPVEINNTVSAFATASGSATEIAAARITAWTWGAPGSWHAQDFTAFHTNGGGNQTTVQLTLDGVSTGQPSTVTTTNAAAMATCWGTTPAEGSHVYSMTILVTGNTTTITLTNRVRIWG